MRVRMTEIITFKFSIPVFQGQTGWLLDCNAPSNVTYLNVWSSKWIIKVSWLSFCGFKTTWHTLLGPKKKKIAGQCLCWAFFRTWTQIRELFYTAGGSCSQELSIPRLGTCHKAYYLCWREVREYIWKDLIKVLKNPIGINAHYCSQCYLRTAGRRHFK